MNNKKTIKFGSDKIYKCYSHSKSKASYFFDKENSKYYQEFKNALESFLGNPNEIQKANDVMKKLKENNQ